MLLDAGAGAQAAAGAKRKVRESSPLASLHWSPNVERGCGARSMGLSLLATSNIETAASEGRG
jgi:hypothetical protein